ncbi:hypothetical protein P7K49_010648 [Saguinus oedipus]|uniref:Uncharacterized protein n=1 Tax=Saguinus oedipus TaxID=9490 RepID=A0ABQ9VRQ3_SAGOE|nr:hypothetical protein P7K49_010648 [Saguinus oedipus]
MQENGMPSVAPIAGTLLQVKNATPSPVPPKLTFQHIFPLDRLKYQGLCPPVPRTQGEHLLRAGKAGCGIWGLSAGWGLDVGSGASLQAGGWRDLRLEFQVPPGYR